MNTFLYAAGGTGFIFLMTTLGAASVFFFRKKAHPSLQRLSLGFAAGVMIAASVWSLLEPAIEAAQTAGMPGWIPAAGGMILGIIFLLAVDAGVQQLQKSQADEAAADTVHLRQKKRIFLLQLAMTVHNIPEGMAVGLSFGLAAEGHGYALSAAMALALGIGIQNLPEGAAIALPLRQSGMPTGKAFLRGMLSGIVEPIFGILTVFALQIAQPIMPWLLSFAAGAMLYVTISELIPQACHAEEVETTSEETEKTDTAQTLGTISVLTGFLLMMILDVALG